MISFAFLLMNHFNSEQIDKNTDSLKGHRVVVMADNHNITVDTHANNVGDVLRQLNIEVGKLDIVEPALLTKLLSNTQIRVTRISQHESVTFEEIPFSIVKYDDPELLIGEEKLIQEGIPGKVRFIKQVQNENGMVVGEKVVSRKVLTPYRSRVVAVGTGQPTPLQSIPQGSEEADGASNDTYPSDRILEGTLAATSRTFTIDEHPVIYKFKLEDVQLTAYSSDFESTGKNPGDPEYGITSSGSTVSEGTTIAVDPTVIPMGWWVYIEGIGYRKAEDTGSAVKGKIIDVFLDDPKEMDEFGRKYGNTVYVIGPEKP